MARTANAGKLHEIGGLQLSLYVAVLITTCDNGGKSTLGKLFVGDIDVYRCCVCVFCG